MKGSVDVTGEIFKIGEKVTVIGTGLFKCIDGLTATVVYDDFIKDYYGVNFGVVVKGITHDLENRLPNHTGLWLSNRVLKKINEYEVELL